MRTEKKTLFKTSFAFCSSFHRCPDNRTLLFVQADPNSEGEKPVITVQRRKTLLAFQRSLCNGLADSLTGRGRRK
jgi:hypothetical protein